MKKILSIVIGLIFSLSAWAGIHSYTNSSVLASGTWVKISVAGSGVCKMSFAELQAAGLNPAELRVFGYGGVQLTQDFSKSRIDDLPQVPVYVGTDYVLFWVQGPIGWTYNGSRFTHTRNTYSNLGYYFLTDNRGSKLTPTAGEAIEGTPTDVYRYTNVQVHDFDSINLVDRTGIAGGGKTFYGEQFKPGSKRSFSFSVPNAIETENSTAVVAVAAYASTASTFMVNFNGTNKTFAVAGIPSSQMYTFGVETSTTARTTSRKTQTIQLTYSNSANSALGWLNYIELNTPCSLQMNGDWMTIRSTEQVGSTTPIRYHLANANSAVQIWDITDRSAIQRMPATLSGSELTWVGSNEDGVREYVAVQTNGFSFVSATVVGTVANQNLHRLSNIDYVIICPEGFEADATRLAQAHQNKEGITWAVVTDKQVYNEFSSGTPDATAYRWLMKMLYDRANGNDIQKPRWLLLIGHGSFDNRGLLPSSGAKLLLTYQSDNSVDEVKAYATDDYFGWLDDNEGTNDINAKMDIGVGRLPVGDLQEAQTTIDKLVAYIEDTEHGKWKNQLAYLADDGQNGLHTKTADESAERVRKSNPDFVVHKIYLDAYPQEVNASGESYPLAKNKVANLLRNGVLFFDYSGHGGYNEITNESILQYKDIEMMTNSKQAFWLFATCNFAQCDAGRRSSAEVAVLNPRGAAIGILAATRTVYATQNTDLNRAVTEKLFAHEDTYHYNATLGEAIMAGKNTLGRSDDGNKLAYVLLGDPALRLHFPTKYWIQTTTEMDTLNALSIQQVNGQIIDEDSLVVDDFNGKVEITVYDKLQSIPTRDNDQVGGEPEVVSYNDYPNTIFSGSTMARNGLFQYSFMVPKDIRYNFGKGRIVYYAHDELHNEDAVGHFEDFTVGGSGSIVAVDTTGPQMTIYLNSIAFRDGDRTYATPRFFADLYDTNGINTAGAGIGHDLMLVIDNDPKQIYTLNEYFTAADNSYQQGQVSYLMNTLPDGPHTLSFRAWDLLNNSTTKSLSFIVEAGLDPSIYSVTTYPNPVRQAGVLNFAVEYDQHDKLLQSELYINNINGQLVYARQQENPDNLSVNMSELSLRPGVYIYTLKIKSENSRYSAASGKIIVVQ